MKLLSLGFLSNRETCICQQTWLSERLRNLGLQKGLLKPIQAFLVIKAWRLSPMAVPQRQNFFGRGAKMQGMPKTVLRVWRSRALMCASRLSLSRSQLEVDL